MLRILLPLVALCASSFAGAQQPIPFDVASERALRHATVEWASIAPHLPDPATATPTALLTAADVLRARRMPADAIEYYGYALKRGGDEVTVINRIGVTELEQNHAFLARVAFKRTITQRKKFAEGWNNLGASESMLGNTHDAIADYSRAVKLERRNATFHINLGTAYFASKDYEAARKQYQVAIKLDPKALDHSGRGGSQIQILSSADRGRFAFEMARLAAGTKDEDGMLRWLGQSSEAGFDVVTAMQPVKEFAPYLSDPRITVLVTNAHLMHARQLASAQPVPSLAAPDAPTQR